MRNPSVRQFRTPGELRTTRPVSRAQVDAITDLDAHALLYRHLDFEVGDTLFFDDVLEVRQILGINDAK